MPKEAWTDGQMPPTQYIHIIELWNCSIVSISYPSTKIFNEACVLALRLEYPLLEV